MCLKGADLCSRAAFLRIVLNWCRPPGNTVEKRPPGKGLASLYCCVHPEMIQSMSYNLAIKFKLKLATPLKRKKIFKKHIYGNKTISEYMAIGKKS